MNQDINPLLVHDGFPPFDRIRPEHIEPAAEYFLKRCNTILEQLESEQDLSWDSLMDPMEEIDLLFEYGWSPIGHLMGVANSDALACRS